MSEMEIGEAELDERVVLVDEKGIVLGSAPKKAAHEPPGQLHLAFSVVLVDGFGRVLLQRRAASKYHFASCWSNACCSHPRPGEELGAAAARRLEEELGLKSELSHAGCFIYRASCPSSGLVEHELDHVFFGTAIGEAKLNRDEVEEICLIEADDLLAGRLSGRLDGPVTPWMLEATRLALARG